MSPAAAATWLAELPNLLFPANSNNAAQERENYTSSNNEVDIADASQSHQMKSGVAEALRGYNDKTKNTILRVDEYRIDFDWIPARIAKVPNDARCHGKLQIWDT